MNGSYKKFDKALYKQYDTKAKEAVLNYLVFHDWYVVDQGEDFGPDLVDTVNNWAHEVEISTVHWDGPWYLRNYSSIPERKLRLLTDYNYNMVYHWLLNKECTHAVVYNMSQQDNNKYLVEVSNKYIKKGELFIRPPLKLCKIIRIK